jgi:hypothetical protein
MNIQAMWKLRDDVLCGRLEPACLVAVFDVVLQELEVRRPKLVNYNYDPRQLELFGGVL